MKIIILITTLFFLSCSTNRINKNKKIESYSLDASNSKNNVYSGKDIISSEFNADKVLIIFENKRSFTNNVKNVTDTLSRKYNYKIINAKDSIKTYSNIELIEKVLIINRI